MLSILLEQVTAQDIPVNIRHLHRLFAGYTLTDKVVRSGSCAWPHHYI